MYVSNKNQTGNSLMSCTLFSLSRLSVLIIILGLYACGGSGVLGLGKRESPDEFSVIAHSPLIVPPEYSLRPPRPGAPRPHEKEVRDVAAGEVFGSSQKKSFNRSAGEQAILTGASALNANPNIRDEIGKDLLVSDSEEESFIDTILFWKDDESDVNLIDASSEANRLRDNAAQGKAPNEAQATERNDREKALLEDLF